MGRNLLFFICLCVAGFVFWFITRKEDFTLKTVELSFYPFSLTSKQRFQMYVNQQTFKSRNIQSPFYFNGTSVTLAKVKELLYACELSLIAYNTSYDDTKKACENFGVQFLGFFSNSSCQAYVCRLQDGTQVLGIQGTEFTWKYSNLWEVWDDLSITPRYLNKRGPGQPFVQYVHSGFYDDLELLWPEIATVLDVSKYVWVCGHSLGGCRAHLARKFIPQSTQVKITSFGAPKGANDAFFNANTQTNTIVDRVLAENDFAGDWQPLLPYTQPTMNFYWLTNGQIYLVNQRNFLNLSMSDHSILNSYLPKLRALIK